MAIETEEDARFVADKIRDGTLTGERKDAAFASLEEFRSTNKPTTKSEEAWNSIKRGTGLAGRYMTETGPLIAAGLTDLAAKGVNYGIAGLDAAGQAIGDTPLDYRLPTDNARTVYEGFSDMGFPEADPENKWDRYGERGGRMMAGGMLLGPVGGRLAATSANPVVAGVGTQMAANPGGQLIATQGAAVAGQATEDAGGSPTQVMMAEVAGGGLAALGKESVAAGTRGAMRGGEAGRQGVVENIENFNRAGTTPSVGQATEGRIAQATEGGMSRSPGSAGQMAKAGEKQASDMSANIEARANQLAGKTSAEQAGRTITEGVKGKGGFLERFRAVQKRLYDELEVIVNPRTPTSVTNTVQVLDDMTGAVSGAANVSEAIRNPALKRVYNALYDDLALTRDGRLPFSALKDLRSMVGEKLQTAGIADDISKVEWKRLYKALSKDMEAAVANNATPEAARAWTRANNHTKAGHGRIDRIASVIKRNGGPEKVFQAAVSGNKEGATVLRAVMQSLNPDEQKVVTATVLRRLGRANPGQQNELGDVFSTERFLTNWAGMSNEAKRTLFDRYGPTFRKDMDAIAKVAANLREGNQVFRNPSGTAQASAQIGAATAFGTLVATGHLGLAAAELGAIIGANGAARVMTNPRVVHWLAQQTQHPTENMSVQMNILLQQAAKDEDVAYFAAALEKVQKDNK